MSGSDFSTVIIKGNDKLSIAACVCFIATFSHSRAEINSPCNYPAMAKYAIETMR